MSNGGDGSGGRGFGGTLDDLARAADSAGAERRRGPSMPPPPVSAAYGSMGPGGHYPPTMYTMPAWPTPHVPSAYASPHVPPAMWHEYQPHHQAAVGHMAAARGHVHTMPFHPPAPPPHMAYPTAAAAPPTMQQWSGAGMMDVTSAPPRHSPAMTAPLAGGSSVSKVAPAPGSPGWSGFHGNGRGRTSTEHTGRSRRATSPLALPASAQSPSHHGSSPPLGPMELRPREARALSPSSAAWGVAPEEIVARAEAEATRRLAMSADDDHSSDEDATPTGKGAAGRGRGRGRSREDRAQRRRELNRVNARKSRLRKKYFVDALIGRVAQLEQEKQDAQTMSFPTEVSLPAMAPTATTVSPDAKEGARRVYAARALVGGAGGGGAEVPPPSVPAKGGSSGGQGGSSSSGSSGSHVISSGGSGTATATGGSGGSGGSDEGDGDGDGESSDPSGGGATGDHSGASSGQSPDEDGGARRDPSPGELMEQKQQSRLQGVGMSDLLDSGVMDASSSPFLRSPAFLLCDPTLPDTPIVFSSPGFCELTGYPLSSVIGRNCRFLQGPGTDPRARTLLRAAQRAPQGPIPMALPILNYRKDGTPFWNHLNMAPLWCARGQPPILAAAQFPIPPPGKDPYPDIIRAYAPLLRATGFASLVEETDAKRDDEPEEARPAAKEEAPAIPGVVGGGLSARVTHSVEEKVKSVAGSKRPRSHVPDEDIAAPPPAPKQKPEQVVTSGY